MALGSSRKAGWALVTGASSGIGEAFARRLARDGYDLILVARREELLQKLAEELSHSHGVSTRVEAADLTRTEDVARMEKQINEIDYLAMLINNAGFNVYGRFTEMNLEKQLEMVVLHDIANLRLTRAALPAMIAEGKGDIISVASLTGLIPWGNNAVYSATKSFLISFNEALQQEIMGTGVRLQVLCPGFTRTEFADAMGVDASGIPNPMWMQPEAVVQESLSALTRGKVVCIPGLWNRSLAFIMQSIPRPLRYRLTSLVSGKFNVS